MSKNYGNNYQSKHFGPHFKKPGNVRNEKRSINYINVLKWAFGFCKCLDLNTEAAPTEDKSCTEIVKKVENHSLVKGPMYGSQDVNKANEEYSSSEYYEEIEEFPPNPERPGLKYKRTRRRRATYKEGDHVSQSSFSFGFGW